MNREAPPLPPGSLSLGDQAGRLMRLTRKEVSEILRDRRTIITLVLMPLLLYPLLMVAFQLYAVSFVGDSQAPKYQIGFRTEEEKRQLGLFLRVGQQSLEQRAPRRPNGDLVRPEPEVGVQAVGDLEAALRDGTIDVAVLPRQDDPFVTRSDQDLARDWDLLYLDGVTSSRDALLYVERLCIAANAEFLGARLRTAGVSQRAVPVLPSAVPVAEPAERKSVSWAAVVPLVLILMTITGAVYPAIDLTAGERERGTLEILVAAPVPRLGLLFAKYVSVLTVAMLTAVANLGMMTVSLLATGLGRQIFGASLTPLTLVQVLGLLLLFTAFFGAVLLCVTSFARSFKEAQAYLIPLMLVSLAPGMLALRPGLTLEGPLAVAPLVNIVLLARDVFAGEAGPATAAVVVVVTLLYALAALSLAARIFGAEAVLYSEQSGWSDLFRRPAAPQPAATPTAALLCLALLFPASFVLTGLIGQAQGLSLGQRLAWMTAVNVLIFGAFPLLSARLGRVTAAGFRLRAPGVQGCAAAVLMGISLWPFALEIIRIQRDVGFATLPEELFEKLSAAEPLRGLPVGLPLLALAVVPAVLEELFFRGYLFAALRTTLRPRTAILASGALFGLFHLLVTDSLAVERFLPSASLGIVLGWVCWKTGSVVPGMLLHAAHNGVVVLLAYHKRELVAWGWIDADVKHLPALWLLAAAVPAGLGALWIWKACRAPDGEGS